jgi:MFS family permease
MTRLGYARVVPGKKTEFNHKYVRQFSFVVAGIAGFVFGFLVFFLVSYALLPNWGDTTEGWKPIGWAFFIGGPIGAGAALGLTGALLDRREEPAGQRPLGHPPRQRTSDELGELTAHPDMGSSDPPT